MKKIYKNNAILCIFGVLIGICNGLFGAGGGIVAVEVLKKNGLDQKKAQSTSIAVILPLCVFSAILYLFRAPFDFKIVLILAPFGLIGALLGTRFMKNASQKTIKRIFCFFLIYAGARMLIGG